MLLYILRHAQAEPGRPGGQDSDRRLTAEGKDALRRVLQSAARSGMNPETVLVSPYIRARETAEIVQQALAVSENVLTTNALAPDSRPESVWDVVRDHQQSSQLMLVGHNPLLSELLIALLGAGGYAIDLNTAGLACVDVGSPGAKPIGRLVWLLTPEVGG